MNQNSSDNSTPKSLGKPPVPEKLASGQTVLLYRKLFDLAAEKLCLFIKRCRPTILGVSQCGQDVFVIDKIFQRKRHGVFLEIGGGDGLYLSNTLVLERDFGWRGILVEPTKAFDAMVKNRPNAKCEHAAIAGSRKKVRLFEILDKGQVAMNPEAARDNTLLSVIEEANAEEPVTLVPDWGTVKASYLVEAITLEFADEA